MQYILESLEEKKIFYFKFFSFFFSKQGYLLLLCVKPKLGKLGTIKQIIPSQMEVAPLHCTVDITQKRRLFKNAKETEKM